MLVKEICAAPAQHTKQKDLSISYVSS